MDNHFDFLFNNQRVDVSFDDNGVAWFHGPQVASILGYSHSPNMYKMLSPNEKGVHIARSHYFIYTELSSTIYIYQIFNHFLL